MTDDAAAATVPRTRGGARRTLKPAVWSAVGFGLSLALRLGSTLVLSRFLLPADYGVMAIANAVIIGIALFSDVGTSPFIIQHASGADARYFNTAWTTDIGRGVLLWLGTLVLAYPLAAWYDAPVLLWVVPTLGAGVMLNGLTSTSLIILTRRMEPARVVLLNFASAAVGVVVTITWVVTVAANVWGFVVGSLASSIVQVVGSHFLLPGHRNRLCWDRRVRTELLRIGKWVFVSTVLNFFADQADRLIVGKYSGLTELGLYHVAGQLCALPVQLLATLGSSILFPFFSECVRSGGNVGGRVRRARQLFQGFGTCMVVGLLVAGPSLVGLLFGERFRPAGWMTQVIAVGGFFKMFGTVGENLIRALCKPQRLAAANGVKVVAMIVLVPAGAAVGGLPGLLAGLAAAEAARYLAFAYTLRQEGMHLIREDVLFILPVVVTGVFVAPIWS